MIYLSFKSVVINLAGLCRLVDGKQIEDIDKDEQNSPISQSSQDIKISRRKRPNKSSTEESSFDERKENEPESQRSDNVTKPRSILKKPYAKKP